MIVLSDCLVDSCVSTLLWCLVWQCLSASLLLVRLSFLNVIVVVHMSPDCLLVQPRVQSQFAPALWGDHVLRDKHRHHMKALLQELVLLWLIGIC